MTAVVEGVDTEPPTAPTGLTAAAAWPTEVDLNWAEAMDNVGVTAYEIYRDEALLTTVGDVTHYADMTALAEHDLRLHRAGSGRGGERRPIRATKPR